MSLQPYYDDGQCVIYHGDCREVLPQIAAGSVSLVFTSPPYNLGDRGFFAIARSHKINPKRSIGGTSRLIQGYGGHDDAMPYDEYRAWQQWVLAEAWRTLANDGAIFYNHKPRVLDGEVRLPTDLNPRLPLRQVIIWDRQRPGINITQTHYVPAVEWLLLFAKPAFRLVNKAAAVVGDIWRIPATNVGNTPERAANLHPAPFPVGLPLRAIATTKPGLVLDPFAGTGATLVAAKSAGRRAIGIEIEERYCEIAARRLGQEVLAL